MYTFNLFCYGHRLSVDEELNNSLVDHDLDFATHINDRKWKVYFPYHGGQVSGSVLSCVFGIEISDNDSNPDYITTIRNAKESDYEEDYKEFLSQYFEYLTAFAEDDSEIKLIMENLKRFTESHSPQFYEVEVSS